MLKVLSCRIGLAFTAVLKDSATVQSSRTCEVFFKTIPYVSLVVKPRHCNAASSDEGPDMHGNWMINPGQIAQKSAYFGKLEWLTG